MSTRDAQISAFIDKAGWGDAVVSLLAGDASNRRYLRLIRPSNAQRAVLMDAPPDKGEDVRPFIQIAEYLTGIGLSAPRIFDRDEDAGFLLLEDLGEVDMGDYATLRDFLNYGMANYPADRVRGSSKKYNEYGEDQ